MDLSEEVKLRIARVDKSRAIDMRSTVPLPEGLLKRFLSLWAVPGRIFPSPEIPCICQVKRLAETNHSLLQVPPRPLSIPMVIVAPFQSFGR